MKNFTRTTFVVLLLAAQFSAKAQSKVQGKVKDEGGKPLQSVSVSLLHAKDSSLVKIDVTDKQGQYGISTTQQGDFLLSFSIVGFEKQYADVFTVAAGKDVTIADVSLSPATSNLKDVTITNKKPLVEVKADKTVFNVEASITAQGSTAMELLQKSPGVQVDNNDNITMKGKTGVRVYIDGKMMQLDTKDLAAYLRSINSNDIEAIEMISNPSAKYDASGNAGVINIRLKKNKKFGTNGSVNAGFVQGITPKGNGSVNLNYRDKKINLFSNAGFNRGIYQNELNIYRIQKDTLYDQKTVMNSDNKNFNVKAGADYFIDSRNTIGVLVTSNFSNSEWSSSSVAPIYYQPTGEFIKQLNARNNVPGKRTNANFNLNYRYADTSGREINFDADYGVFRGEARSIQPNDYVYPGSFIERVVNRNNTPTDIDIYTAKLDVEQKLGKGKLGYGLKFSYVKTKNTFEFFQDTALDKPAKVLDKSNTFAYTENVNAAYINYQQQLNEKWSIQAGLRAEQTNSDGDLKRDDGTAGEDDRVKRHYFNLFPSGAITWNMSQKHTLNLTYSRRIDRPRYQDLNPFENKLDELTYERGNPFLRPQYTHNVELSHILGGMLNTTLGYSYVNDFATEATDTVKNATFVQQKNLARQQIISLSVGSPLPIKPWWNGYANVYGNMQMFDGVIGENKVDREIFTFGAYMQHTFTLGKGYTAELSGWFNGPSVWGGTWKTRSQGAIDAGLQKLVLQKRATVKIAVTDIFFTAPWTATNDFGGLYIRGGGNWESRTFRASFNWRFGSSQVKAARQRKTGLESEAGRIKGK